MNGGGQEKVYPVAERFHSIQGEGAFTGTPMNFIRLAGCTVGKYTSPKELCDEGKGALAELRILEPKHSICTTALGEQFVCDTDYFVKEKMTATEMVDDSYESRICLTGGEPLMHDLVPIYEEAKRTSKTLHLETSGTIQIPEWMWDTCWVTCSPKIGALIMENAHLVKEYKVVITSEMLRLQEEILFSFIEELHKVSPSAPIYAQSVNPINHVDFDNTAVIASKVLTRYPEVRLSVQLHKILNMQ